MSDNVPPPYGQQPPGQQPPGQQPPGYGPPPYGYGQPYPYRPPNHPSAVMVLVLGILGLVMCQVLSVFAWVIGNRVVREIDASGGQAGGRDLANIGRICGIIGTVLLAVGLVGALLVIGLFSIASLSVSS